MKRVMQCGALFGALLLAGTAPAMRPARTGTFALNAPNGPLVSGSRFALDVSGVTGAFSLSVLGAGHVENNLFIAPAVDARTQSTLVAAANGAIALATIRTIPPPAAHQPLIAVATYKDGIALHDPRTFALLGYAAIGSAPGDVVFTRGGDLAAPQTDGDSLARIARAPWDFDLVGGVSQGDEAAFDPKSGAIFVSNRDAGGAGGVSRIDGTRVRTVRVGETIEGLAVDTRRGVVFAGDVSRGIVNALDANTLRTRYTIAGIPRVFGLAIDVAHDKLYAVSNTSPSMPERGGRAMTIDLRTRRIVARSARMTFPLGAALDAAHGRLFVTDEASDAVYVLRAPGLQREATIRTCKTPWRPSIAAGRLYVPCAQNDSVDVFALSTLKRVAGAPFRTGGFPLHVAVST